ncbi:MAG: hypothetical protein IT306_16710 [Chloroflexi bacterium]|nr:hypothetical protein [Chloroflexota bacterium]
MNGQPWVVLLPVLLDLFFLLGPRVSIAPVVSQLVTTPSVSRSLGAESPASVIAFAEDANLLGLLSPGGVTLPTIVPALQVARGTFVMVDAISSAFLIALGALLFGALLGSIYQVIIAQQARDGQVEPLNTPIFSIVAWLRLIALAVLVVTGALLLTIPFGFLAAITRLAGVGLDALVLAVVGALALVAQLYLYFASDAILIRRVGPLQAIKDSIAVVHSGVWATLLLAIVVTASLIAMALLWNALASVAPWGLALGIVGNAYIASGLVAAKMLFFQERIETLLAERS